MNNRELSLLIWGVALLTFFLLFKSIRSNIGGLIKAFFAWKLTLSHIAMLSYISTIVFILYKIGLWNQSLIKDTIVWSLFSSFVLVVTSIKASKEKDYFKSIVIDNIKVAAIIEFITNAYVFSLTAELILVPVITFFAVLSAVAGLKEEHLQVKKVLDFTLAAFGLIFLIYAFKQAMNDFKNFSSVNNLLSFFLPIILTLSFIPFLYLMLLIMEYETLFVRMSFFKNREIGLDKSFKKTIIKECHLNLDKIRRYSKGIKLHEIQTKADIITEINRLKNFYQL